MARSSVPSSVRVEPPNEAAGRGVCIWLTGPSGAGKSTLTRQLLPLLERRGRSVSVLDVVPLLRKLPCERTSEGKLLRKAFVAGEVARHGGIAICVTVSARRRTREAAREIVGVDRFVEVLVDAPRDVTRARKAARNRKRSVVKHVRHVLSTFAGRIGLRPADGYETPIAPDLRIDSATGSPEQGARALFTLLVERGFIVASEPRES
jgi:sulfate adenylyltransferase